MVVSAGNDGPNCSTIGAPADEDAVLTVGASTQEGEIIDFSSRGPAGEDLVKPDLVAPGVGILSSIPGGGFGAAAGTSMAGPHVAGLVALLWSAESLTHRRHRPDRKAHHRDRPAAHTGGRLSRGRSALRLHPERSAGPGAEQRIRPWGRGRAGGRASSPEPERARRVDEISDTSQARQRALERLYAR